MSETSRLLGMALLSAAFAGPLSGQGPGALRPLSAAQTGCDSADRTVPDTVYESTMVDEPVVAQRLLIKEMPLRIGEVLTGRAGFRFLVEPSGRIDRCSIELIEESAPAWTDAVLKELRRARYRAARRGGEKVWQRVYQVFTYHHDGRFLQGP